MGQMVEGRWTTDDVSHVAGRFQRQASVFRGRVTPEDLEVGRYHLYVSHACPWAHRTLVVRALRGLEEAIGVSVVHPDMGDDGWRFGGDHPGVSPAPVHGFTFLREAYAAAAADYTGRVTVPVLWDRALGRIVNNESREIIRLLDTVFDPLALGPSLRPAGLAPAIDAAIDAIYEPINNGVYRAGFAGTQGAYEAAVTELFAALDDWEGVLGDQPYLCGDTLTEADVCLFATLVRFDAVYVTHFKCNLRRIRDYPNLWAFLGRMLAKDGVRETVHLDHIKAHYFRSHPRLNPGRVVPLGPIDPLPV